MREHFVLLEFDINQQPFGRIEKKIVAATTTTTAPANMQPTTATITRIIGKYARTPWMMVFMVFVCCDLRRRFDCGDFDFNFLVLLLNLNVVFVVVFGSLLCYGQGMDLAWIKDSIGKSDHWVSLTLLYLVLVSMYHVPSAECWNGIVVVVFVIAGCFRYQWILVATWIQFYMSAFFFFSFSQFLYNFSSNCLELFKLVYTENWIRMALLSLLLILMPTPK